MSRKAQKKYGPGGQYYRKRIRRPDGKWEDVYAKTTAELAEKVTVRQAQLAAEAAAAAGAPKDPYFFRKRERILRLRRQMASSLRMTSYFIEKQF